MRARLAQPIGPHEAVVACGGDEAVLERVAVDSVARARHVEPAEQGAVGAQDGDEAERGGADEVLGAPVEAEDWARLRVAHLEPHLDALQQHAVVDVPEEHL